MRMIDVKKNNALAMLTVLLATTSATAHEFWVDPDLTQVKRGQLVSAQVRVGQNLSGAALPYVSKTFDQMRHWVPGTQDGRLIAAREGDRPAIATPAVQEIGVHRITVQTKPAYIVFEDMAEFTDYLEYEGAGAIADQHRLRGLSETDIAEEYLRYAKALVQVGDLQKGQIDAPTGMAFELVALQSPFAGEAQTLDVQLLWRGDVSGDVQVAVFFLPAGGRAPNDTKRWTTTTDKMGRATITLDGPGDYLLNAVRIDAVDGPGSVIWQSHWASLTFTTTR